MKKYIVLLVSLLLMGQAFGDDGDFKKTKFGFVPFWASYHVNDPIGDTDSKSDGYFMNFAVTHSFGRDHRLWAELGQVELEIGPTTDIPSQKVDSKIISVAYQRKLRFFRSIKPWIGAGLTLSDTTYENRFFVDQDGFYAGEYPNRSESELGYFVQIQAEKDFEKLPITLNFGLSYYETADNGLTGPRLHVGIFY